MSDDTFQYAADSIVGALGEAIEYDGAPARAVFGSEFAAVQSGNVRLSSRRPEIQVSRGHLPQEPTTGEPLEPQEGHQVRIRGVDYVVVTVRPDTEAVSWTLTLKRES